MKRWFTRWQTSINARLSTAMNRGWSLSLSFPKSPFCPLAKNNQNLNRSQNFTKKKLVQNFVSYKTPLMTKDGFEMERDGFESNSLKFKLNSKFLNWGKTEFQKLLLILHNNLKNFQHESCSNFQALQLSC